MADNMSSVVKCLDCMPVNISEGKCPDGCVTQELDHDNMISKLSHTEDNIIGIYMTIIGKFNHPIVIFIVLIFIPISCFVIIS